MTGENMKDEHGFFTDPMTGLCAALCKAAGVRPPEQAAPARTELTDELFSRYGAFTADRIMIYNPDAIGDWVMDKYIGKFARSLEYAPVRHRFITVFPPKTPVCFASMYTGAEPEVHGILKYEKPVVTIDSIFDAFIKAGKKPCIVSVKNQSMDRIFRGRDMDYFSERYDDEVVEKALELIKKDEYDLLCVYNQRYDDAIHFTHPKSRRARRALDCYNVNFDKLVAAVKEHWSVHDTLIGMCPDHGVHRMLIGTGNHGKNIPKDMNISHLFGFLPKQDR